LNALKEVEQRLAEDRAARERDENKRAERDEELHRRDLEKIDEQIEAKKKSKQRKRKSHRKAKEAEKDAAIELELLEWSRTFKSSKTKTSPMKKYI